MSANNRNRLKTTVSAVASSGLGAFTISTASSGYRSFVAGDDGLTFDGVLITEGTAWEVRDGCVYTHSTASLSRGTLMDSSTGSAIAFTSAVVLSQGGTADFARRAESAGLRTSISSSDANLTMEVGVLHCVDISGFTADRTATLPAVAAVDDRVGLYISTGDDAYEMLMTAASGDTLNGVAGGTEWSRLFITGELVVFRCIVANTTWVVDYDGRIPQQCACRLTTAATAETAATVTTPTDKSGAWTAFIDNASLATVSTSDIKTRRAGNFLVSVQGVSNTDVTSGNYFSCYLYLSGNSDILVGAQFAQGQTTVGRIGPQTALVPLVVDGYIRYRWRSQQGSKGLAASPSPGQGTVFSLLEVL